MKHYKILTVLLVALMISCAGTCFALNLVSSTFKMQQGSYKDGLVWYIQTDTGNIRYAQQNCLTLAPLLESADGAVPRMWIVDNPFFDPGTDL